MYSHPYEYAEFFIPAYNSIDNAKVNIESTVISNEGKEYKGLHFYGNTGNPATSISWYGFTPNDEYTYIFKDYLEESI